MENLPPPALALQAEDVLFDSSTAPTSPDGSLTFSPVLQALKLQGALEGAEKSNRRIRNVSPFTDANLSSRRSQIQNVCCIGAGYVGGPTAAMMALHNQHITFTVVDRDPVRIRQWNSKHLPIHEPGLHEILRIGRDGSKDVSFLNAPIKENVDTMSSASSATSNCESSCDDDRENIYVPARSPNLFFSTEVSKHISEADIIMIAVNTPTKKRGWGAGKATDMTALETVSREVAIHAKAGAIIVEKSTVPCQTAEMIQTILKTHRPNLNFEILSNPEFLAEGTAIQDLLHPDRVIIGSAPTTSGQRAAETLSSIYQSWIPRSKIITMNNWSAELSKLLSNAMLAQRISSINSISAICEATGADIAEVAQSIGLDTRIGNKFLKAGVGFGGSCFKKDILSLTYIAESLGFSEVAEYWRQVLSINEWQMERFVRRTLKCLNGTLVGKKVAVLGYAFKKGTADTRESPSLDCIKILLEDEPREVAIYDPCCRPEDIREEAGRLFGREVLKENGGPVEVYGDAYEACRSSHGVVIMTESDEFRNSDSANDMPSRSHRNRDPRPFQHLEPTELGILTLQNYLNSKLYTDDPLERFNPEPTCDADCKHCTPAESMFNPNTCRKLDWSRIAYHLQTPKWIFDGRGVLDVGVMENLGVGVVSIGKNNQMNV